MSRNLESSYAVDWYVHDWYFRQYSTGSINQLFIYTLNHQNPQTKHKNKHTQTHRIVAASSDSQNTSCSFTLFVNSSLTLYPQTFLWLLYFARLRMVFRMVYLNLVLWFWCCFQFSSSFSNQSEKLKQFYTKLFEYNHVCLAAKLSHIRFLLEFL